MSLPSSVWLAKSTIWPGKDAARDAYSCASGCVSSTSVTFGAPAAVTTPISVLSSLDQIVFATSATGSWKRLWNWPVVVSSVPIAPGPVSSLWVAYTVPLVLTRSIHRCLPSDLDALTSTHLPSCIRYSSVRSSYSPCSSRLDEPTAHRGSLALPRAMLPFPFGGRPSGRGSCGER